MTTQTAGSTRLALLAGAALAALLALFAGLGHQVPDQARAATTNVNVGQTNGGGGATGVNEYNSADITISEGDSVDFDWFDGVHDATSYAGGDGTPDWQAPLMTSSATFSQTFATAGVVTYYCTIHADWADAAPGVIDANIAAGKMVGKITVVGAATDTPTATDEPATDTPTETPADATATPTDIPPTATSTEAAPTETPAEATATDEPPTATATDEPPTATATDIPPTATPGSTPADATATAAPPTVTATGEPPAATATATEEPAATSQPTATEPAPTAQPRTVNVETGSDWFGDASFEHGIHELTVQAGDTVQWNIVEAVHTVYECGDNWSQANSCASAAWSSDILQEGDIFSQRFSTAGTYYYLCTLHPLTMRGSVTVEGSAPPNEATPTDASTETPAATSTETPAAVSTPGPQTSLPNSGYGPFSQESAHPDSPLGRAFIIAAAVAALLAAALVWKEVAWGTRN